MSDTEDPNIAALYAASGKRWARYCVLGQHRKDGTYTLVGSFPAREAAVRNAKFFARERGKACSAFIVFDAVDRHICGVAPAASTKETTSGET